MPYAKLHTCTNHRPGCRLAVSSLPSALARSKRAPPHSPPLAARRCGRWRSAGAFATPDGRWSCCSRTFLCRYRVMRGGHAGRWRVVMSQMAAPLPEYVVLLSAQAVAAAAGHIRRVAIRHMGARWYSDCGAPRGCRRRIGSFTRQLAIHLPSGFPKRPQHFSRPQGLDNGPLVEGAAFNRTGHNLQNQYSAGQTVRGVSLSSGRSLCEGASTS